MLEKKMVKSAQKASWGGAGNNNLRTALNIPKIVISGKVYHYKISVINDGKVAVPNVYISLRYVQRYANLSDSKVLKKWTINSNYSLVTIRDTISLFDTSYNAFLYTTISLTDHIDSFWDYDDMSVKIINDPHLAIMPFNSNESYTTCSSRLLGSKLGLYKNEVYGGFENSRDTLTVYPKYKGDMVSVKFNYVHYSYTANWLDSFSIYDGLIEDSLIGRFHNNISITKPYISTKGPLTFYLRSDNNYGGLDANLSCVSPY
jgi:hypothetical protein